VHFCIKDRLELVTVSTGDAWETVNRLPNTPEVVIS